MKKLDECCEQYKYRSLFMVFMVIKCISLVVVNGATLCVLDFNSYRSNFTTVIISVSYHSPYVLVLISHVTIRFAKFIIRIIIYVASLHSSGYICTVGIWTHE